MALLIPPKLDEEQPMATGGHVTRGWEHRVDEREPGTYRDIAQPSYSTQGPGYKPPRYWQVSVPRQTGQDKTSRHRGSVPDGPCATSPAPLGGLATTWQDTSSPLARQVQPEGGVLPKVRKYRPGRCYGAGIYFDVGTRPPMYTITGLGNPPFNVTFMGCHLPRVVEKRTSPRPTALVQTWDHVFGFVVGRSLVVVPVQPHQWPFLKELAQHADAIGRDTLNVNNVLNRP